MTRSWKLGTWSLVVVLAVLGAPGTSWAGEEGLDEWIDIDLEGADAQETLRSFVAILEPEDARVDPAIDGRVNIRLENVRVRTVLDALCESIGCTWSYQDGVFRADAAEHGRAPASGLDERIDLDLADAPAHQVLESFGRILQAEIVLDETVGGTITVTLDGVPVREALDRVCEQADCRWTLGENPDGHVLRIEAR